ncbi:hypothetical protein D3C77_576820 [compost metagenome]
MIAEFDCPLATATINNVIADIADSPPASPSRPSEKLITVVTPKIHNIVNINCNIPGNTTYSPEIGLKKPVNAMPEAKTITAADTCTISFGRAGKSLPFVLYQSSSVPMTSSNIPPINIATVSMLNSLPTTKYVTKNPINMT